MSHHTRIDMYGKWYASWCPTWLLNVLLVVFYRSIVSLVDMNIGVCPSLIDWLQWTWLPSGLDPELWISGCSIDNFTPENKTKAMRERLTQGKPELPLVIYVGRMAREKDTAELLPVLRELNKRMDGKVRVALIGGGPMKERLEVEAHDATDFILIAGIMLGKDLRSACECPACVEVSSSSSSLSIRLW
jgi:glycosyltransferase involved in cell wall biosynthesis